MKQVWFSTLSAAVLPFIFFVLAVSSHAKSPDITQQLPVAEFESASIEQQISFAEQFIDADSLQVKNLLESIAPQFDSLTKNQRHRVLLLRAVLSQYKADLSSANGIFERIKSEQPSVSTLARMLYLQARSAEYMDDFTSAFKYLNKADQLPKDQLSATNKVHLLTLAADLNAIAARFDIALDYTEQAITLAREFDDIELICHAASGMANILIEMNNYNESLLTQSNEAISACEIAGNQLLLAMTYQDLSMYYYQRGNYKRQQELLTRAMVMYRENKYEMNIPSTKLGLLNSYLADEQLVDAQHLLDELFEFVRQNWQERELKVLYLAKSSLLEKQGDSEQALANYKKYFDLEQQDIESGSLITVAYHQAQFDSKINQQVAKLSEVELEYANLISKIGSLQIWLLAIGATLLLSFSAYALSFFHRRRKISVIEDDKFDDLTSVLQFEQGLYKARTNLQQQRDDIEYYAVASIDIDLLKAINHSFDYDFGDRLIRAFAMELEDIFSQCGIITRVRRNDFVVFFSTNDEGDISYLLSQVSVRLANLSVKGVKPNATCSIGYAVEAITPEMDVVDLCSFLVGQASIALRHSKFDGGNKSTKYDQNLTKVSASNNRALIDFDAVEEQIPAESF